MARFGLLERWCHGDLPTRHVSRRLTYLICVLLFADIVPVRLYSLKLSMARVSSLVELPIGMRMERAFCPNQTEVGRF